MNQVLERRYARMPRATGLRRLVLLFLLSSITAGLWSIVIVPNGWAVVPSTLGQPASVRMADDWRTPQRDVAGDRRQQSATTFLFGNTTIESRVDVRSTGSVAAFPFVDRVPGVVSAVTLYVDLRTKSKDLIVALYSNRGRQPGARIAMGFRKSLTSGSWDTVEVSRVRVKPGRTYWIAVLAQGGRLDLRDANTDRCNRHRSRSSTLTLHSLPRAWGDGRRAKPCRISAFVSGTLWGTIPVPAASARAPGRSPTSHGLPIITGVARQGQKLMTSTGSWSGHPSSYTYGWEDCDSTGDACTLISGASSSSHTVQASDVGWLIRSLVTATNAGGSTTVQSGPTVAVIQLPPANTVPPSIIAVADPADALSAAVGLEASNVGSSKRVGVTASETVASTAQQGDTLTTTNGSWSNSPTSFSYQWQQCSSSCTNITGATTSSYVLQSSDVGKAVDVIVTATNAGGSTAAQASPTAAVTLAPPVNTGPPLISGIAQQGNTLTTTNGTWSNSPTSFSYQWQDCSSSCTNISGATGPSYTLQASAVGETIDVVVTATNAGGSTAFPSSPTAAVTPSTPSAPVNTTLPTISGTAQQGDTLTASQGSWSNSPTSYAYQWQDCNSSSGSCSNITSATSSSYTVAVADEDHTIVVVVTATNAGGPASATSTATSPGTGPAAARARQHNTADDQRDRPAGRHADGVAGVMVEQSDLLRLPMAGLQQLGRVMLEHYGRHSSSYTVAVADENHTIVVVVTATNAGGPASADSTATSLVPDPPPPAPVNTALPTISGTAQQGDTLTRNGAPGRTARPPTPTNGRTATAPAGLLEHYGRHVEQLHGRRRR